MDPLDEEALRILPVYKRYEKLFETKLPWMPRTAASMAIAIFGLACFHLVTNVRRSFWEGIVVSLLLLIAVLLFTTWGFIGVFRPKTKNMDMEFRDDCALEKKYCRELSEFSLASRQIILKYFQQYWAIEEVRYKTWAGICLTVGGIASTLPEWTGKPKATYSFLVVVVSVAYVWQLIKQISLAKSKRFGELLERIEE